MIASPVSSSTITDDMMTTGKKPISKTKIRIIPLLSLNHALSNWIQKQTDDNDKNIDDPCKNNCFQTLIESLVSNNNNKNQKLMGKRTISVPIHALIPFFTYSDQCLSLSSASSDTIHSLKNRKQFFQLLLGEDDQADSPNDDDHEQKRTGNDDDKQRQFLFVNEDEIDNHRSDKRTNDDHGDDFMMKRENQDALSRVHSLSEIENYLRREWSVSITHVTLKSSYRTKRRNVVDGEDDDQQLFIKRERLIRGTQWDARVDENEHESSIWGGLNELIHERILQINNDPGTGTAIVHVLWEMNGSEKSFVQIEKFMSLLSLHLNEAEIEYGSFRNLNEKYTDQIIRIRSTSNRDEETIHSSEYTLKSMTNTYRLSVSKMLSETRSLLHASEVMLSHVVMKSKIDQKKSLMDEVIKARRLLAMVENLLSSDDIFGYGPPATDLMSTLNHLLSKVQTSAKQLMTQQVGSLIHKEKEEREFSRAFEYYSNGRYYRHSTPRFISFQSDFKVEKPEHDSIFNEDDMSIPIIVFNDLSWQRSEMVEIAISTTDVHDKDFLIDVFDELGDSVVAQLVPNLSMHHAPIEWFRLVFIAKDVPALGTRTYFLSRRRKFETHKHYKDNIEAGSSTIMSTVLLSDNSKFHELLKDQDLESLHFKVEKLGRKDIVLNHQKQSVGFQRNTGNLAFITTKVPSKGRPSTFFLSEQYFTYNAPHSNESFVSLISYDWLLGFLICSSIGYLLGLIFSKVFVGSKIVKSMTKATQRANSSPILMNGKDNTRPFGRYQDRGTAKPNPFAISSSKHGQRHSFSHIIYNLLNHIRSNKDKKQAHGLVAFSFGMVGAIITSNIIFHDYLIITSILSPLFVGIILGFLAGLVFSLFGVKSWVIFGIVFVITYSTSYFAQPWMIATGLDNNLALNDLIVFEGPLMHEMNQQFNSSFSGLSVLQTTRLMESKYFMETESTIYRTNDELPKDLGHDTLVSMRINPSSLTNFMSGNQYETGHFNGLQKSKFRYLRRHNPSIYNYLPKTNVALVTDEKQHLTVVSSQRIPMTVFAGRTMEWMLPVSSSPDSKNLVDDAIKMRLYIGPVSNEKRNVDGSNEPLSINSIREQYQQLNAELHRPFYLFMGAIAPTHYHLKRSTRKEAPRSKDGRLITVDEEHEEYEYIDLWKQEFQPRVDPLHSEFVQFLAQNNIELVTLQYRTDLSPILMSDTPQAVLMMRFMRNGASNTASTVSLKFAEVQRWFPTQQSFQVAMKVRNDNIHIMLEVTEEEKDSLALMRPHDDISTILLIAKS